MEPLTILGALILTLAIPLVIALGVLVLVIAPPTSNSRRGPGQAVVGRIEQEKTGKFEQREN